MLSAVARIRHSKEINQAMTDKELEQLEVNALALRKIADTFLQQLQAARKGAASAQGRKRMTVKVDRMATIKARILSGKRKPDPKQ